MPNKGLPESSCPLPSQMASEPVVTLCGHLYCWPCLYRWLQVQSHCRTCPVCKAGVEKDKVSLDHHSLQLVEMPVAPSDPVFRSWDCSWTSPWLEQPSLNYVWAASVQVIPIYGRGGNEDPRSKVKEGLEVPETPVPRRPAGQRPLPVVVRQLQREVTHSPHQQRVLARFRAGILVSVVVYANRHGGGAVRSGNQMRACFSGVGCALPLGLSLAWRV